MKETIPSSSLTWSEMGKQNQAKEVYWHGIVSEVYFCLFFLMFIINICLIFFTAVKTANYNYHNLL